MFPFIKIASSPISSFHVNGLKTEPLHYPERMGEAEAVNDISTCIKYFFAHPEEANQERLNALWRRVKELERGPRLHQIKEAAELYMTAAFFQDEKMQTRAARRLYALVEKFIANDPVQEMDTIEQLLDCINIGERMAVNGVKLREYVKPMLLRLGSDPAAVQLKDYARRLYIIK